MKPSLGRVFAAVTLVVLVALAAGEAQGPRPMSLVDLREVPNILDPQLAPDGHAVTYQLTQVDWKANRRVPHLWRQDLAARAPVQLTFGDGGETSPRWSPDGKQIVFLRGGQIFLMPAGGGNARALTVHATAVSSPAWSPDGNLVYFLASDPQTPEDRAREQSRDDVYAFGENYRQRHLWNVTVATENEHRLTGGEFSVLSYRVSRDGRRIAAHRSPSPLPLDNERSEVWVIDADGSHASQLTRNAVEESEAEISPDGAQVLFLADANQRLDPYYTSTLFLVLAGGGTPRMVLQDFPYWIDRATWSKDGQSVLAAVHMGVHSEIFQIDVASKTAKQLTNGQHSIPPAPAPAWNFVASADRIVFLFDEPTRFGDVWTLAPGSSSD